MASDLLHVETLDNDPTKAQLTLRLTMWPQESRFCIAKPFIIMLLEHADDAGVTDSNVERPDPDEWEEAGNKWYDYVSSVEVIDVAHYPRAEPPSDLTGDDLAAWKDEQPKPAATYVITFVGPEWCAHVPKGATWMSTAYDELETGSFYGPESA